MVCHQGLSLASPIIAACAGLGGVALGGAITIWSQAKERRQALIRERLGKFYSPLLGIRMQIRAKSEVRQKVHSSANANWQVLFNGIENPGDKTKITKERGPAFKAVFEYSEEQLKTDLVPLYNEMVTLFTTNMQFADEATRKHFGTLVEFVELWNRWLRTPIPPEVILSLNHSEKNLEPFYADLEAQFRALRKQLE